MYITESMGEPLGTPTADLGVDFRGGFTEAESGRHTPITLKSRSFFLIYNRPGERILIKEYKSWRILLLYQSLTPQYTEYLSNEEVLTVDDNMGMYVLMLNGVMRDFAGSHHRALDTYDADIAR